MTHSQTLTLAGVPESLYSEAIAAQAGITLPAGTIAALFDAIDVTDVYEVGPRERLAQLGLAIITEEAA